MFVLFCSTIKEDIRFPTPQSCFLFLSSSSSSLLLPQTLSKNKNLSNLFFTVSHFLHSQFHSFSTSSNFIVSQQVVRVFLTARLFFFANHSFAHWRPFLSFFFFFFFFFFLLLFCFCSFFFSKKIKRNGPKG